jgi:hypothetical protein
MCAIDEDRQFPEEPARLHQRTADCDGLATPISRLPARLRLPASGSPPPPGFRLASASPGSRLASASPGSRLASAPPGSRLASAPRWRAVRRPTRAASRRPCMIVVASQPPRRTATSCARTPAARRSHPAAHAQSGPQDRSRQHQRPAAARTAKSTRMCHRKPPDVTVRDSGGLTANDPPWPRTSLSAG